MLTNMRILFSITILLFSPLGIFAQNAKKNGTTTVVEEKYKKVNNFYFGVNYIPLGNHDDGVSVTKNIGVYIGLETPMNNWFAMINAIHFNYSYGRSFGYGDSWDDDDDEKPRPSNHSYLLFNYSIGGRFLINDYVFYDLYTFVGFSYDLTIDDYSPLIGLGIGIGFNVPLIENKFLMQIMASTEFRTMSYDLNVRLGFKVHL